MKIKTKLLGIIVFIVLSIFISLGIFMFFLQVQKTILKEKTIVINLQEQLYQESSQINDLFYTAVNTSLENYKLVTENTIIAFNNLIHITYLKKNVRIKESLDQINQMNEYMTKRRETLFLTADNFLKTGEKLGLISTSMALSDFLSLQYQVNKPLFLPYLEVANAYAGSLRVLSQSCTTSISIIKEQIELIEIESKAMTRNSIIIAILIAFVLISSVFFISILLLNDLSSRIMKLSDATKLFSSGDLGTTISLKGNDEIAELGSSMEKMRENLSVSIVKIQSASAVALKSKNEMEKAVEESEAETSLLTSQINAINTGAEDLYSSAQVSDSAVQEISKEVTKVTLMISSQSAMVEESAASITQMAASISSLSNIMQKNKKGSENLVKTASLGEEQISNTAESIDLIQQSVSTIKDMAELIQGIAAQTNILAMNAAIEAAHAGESGKGFSVVADEIRTLAEASSENSQSISKSLNEIIKTIEKANMEGKKTALSFQEIQKGIIIVSSSFDEILNGLLELTQGGNQIMEAMNELASYTTDINDNSSSIKNQTSLVSDAISDVNMTANNFIAASKQAKLEVEKIHLILSTISEHAESIENISVQLHNEASQYTVQIIEEE